MYSTMDCINPAYLKKRFKSPELMITATRVNIAPSDMKTLSQMKFRAKNQNIIGRNFIKFKANNNDIEMIKDYDNAKSCSKENTHDKYIEHQSKVDFENKVCLKSRLFTLSKPFGNNVKLVCDDISIFNNRKLSKSFNNSKSSHDQK